MHTNLKPLKIVFQNFSWSLIFLCTWPYYCTGRVGLYSNHNANRSGCLSIAHCHAIQNANQYANKSVNFDGDRILAYWLGLWRWMGWRRWLSVQKNVTWPLPVYFLFCFCLVLLSMLLASPFFSFVQTIQSFLWPQLILQLTLHHCLPFLSVPPSLPPPPPPPVIANLYCNRFPLTPGSGFFSAFKLRKQPEISRYSMPATYDNGSKKVVQIPGATQVVKHQIRRNRCDGIHKCIHKRARAQECTAPHE